MIIGLAAARALADNLRAARVERVNVILDRVAVDLEATLFAGANQVFRAERVVVVSVVEEILPKE